MKCRRTPEDRIDLIRIELRDGGCCERDVEPFSEKKRRVEGAFHGELLVEHHADQQSEGV